MKIIREVILAFNPKGFLGIHRRIRDLIHWLKRDKDVTLKICNVEPLVLHIHFKWTIPTHPFFFQ